jgi:hypothetical protein
VNAIVFVSLMKGPFVWVGTGSSGTKTPAAKGFKTSQGQRATKLTKTEYAAACQEAMKHFLPGYTGRQMESAILVHDRAAIHHNSSVEVGRNKQVRAIKAPPRSPDLMPLDYCVFGSVKNKMLRLGLRAQDWSIRAQTFVELLEGFDATKCIEAFKKKLHLCIEAGGGHFSER